MHAQSLNHVRLFATLWTVALQAPLSTGFSRQEYWSETGLILQCKKPLSCTELIVHIKLDPTEHRFRKKNVVSVIFSVIIKLSIILIWKGGLRTSSCLLNFTRMWEGHPEINIFPKKVLPHSLF